MHTNRPCPSISGTAHVQFAEGLHFSAFHLVYPQINFSITHKDYVRLYKPKLGRCVASDFSNSTFREVVDNIETIGCLSLEYVTRKPSPSKRRGRPLFIPDEPKNYSVCGTMYSLTKELHNRLCLLRGVLVELLPNEDVLGSPLQEVVRASDIFGPLKHLSQCLKEGIANRVLRSLEPGDPSSDYEVSTYLKNVYWWYACNGRVKATW